MKYRLSGRPLGYKQFSEDTWHVQYKKNCNANFEDKILIIFFMEHKWEHETWVL